MVEEAPRTITQRRAHRPPQPPGRWRTATMALSSAQSASEPNSSSSIGTPPVSRTVTPCTLSRPGHQASADPGRSPRRPSSSAACSRAGRVCSVSTWRKAARIGGPRSEFCQEKDGVLAALQRLQRPAEVASSAIYSEERAAPGRKPTPTCATVGQRAWRGPTATGPPPSARGRARRRSAAACSPARPLVGREEQASLGPEVAAVRPPHREEGSLRPAGRRRSCSRQRCSASSSVAPSITTTICGSGRKTPAPARISACQ